MIKVNVSKSFCYILCQYLKRLHLGAFILIRKLEEYIKNEKIYENLKMKNIFFFNIFQA
jgi:hypothetical protein